MNPRFLARLAARLERAEVRPDSVVGRLQGQEVEIRLAEVVAEDGLAVGGPGETATRWTEVRCRGGGGPLSLSVICRSRRARRFADAFTIDAAPAAVTDRLLDDELREAILLVRPDALTASDAAFQMRWDRWIDDPPRLLAAAALLATLAARLPEARVAAEPAPAQAGGPFRAEADAAPVRAAHATWRREIRRLGGFGGVLERSGGAHGLLLAVLGAAGVIAVIAIAATSC